MCCRRSSYSGEYSIFCEVEDPQSGDVKARTHLDDWDKIKGKKPGKVDTEVQIHFVVK